MIKETLVKKRFKNKNKNLYFRSNVRAHTYARLGGRHGCPSRASAVSNDDLWPVSNDDLWPVSNDNLWFVSDDNLWFVSNDTCGP